MLAVEPPSMLAPLPEELVLPSLPSVLPELLVLPGTLPELPALPAALPVVPALLAAGLLVPLWADPLSPPELPGVPRDDPLPPVEDGELMGRPEPPSVDVPAPALLLAAPLLLPPGASITEPSADAQPPPAGTSPVIVSQSPSDLRQVLIAAGHLLVVPERHKSVLRASRNQILSSPYHRGGRYFRRTSRAAR
jgi:hypothetical protein